MKVTSEGKVKVLDFGLAKAVEHTRPSATLSNSPTLLSRTMGGVIIGTAAYMSPEQAKGRNVDRRTDIFAFGCVLYEMLTGHQAFDGEDVTEILSRVVTIDPAWNRLPADTPTAVRRMLQRALKKDPRQRLSDIRDARIEIEEAENEAPQNIGAKPVKGGRLHWIAFAAAAVAAAVLAIPAVNHLREDNPPEMRVEIVTPSTPAPLHFALSPDGRYLVFVASGDGPQRLWLRALDKTVPQPLAGTDGAEYPFWSKDSRSIGFFSSGKLYKVGIDGAQPQAVADAPNGRGGTCNADGTILFSPTATSPLLRVAASGGDPSAVTRLESGAASHRYPHFLPDGRHFLFFNQNGTPERGGLYLASLDGGEPKLLAGADTDGVHLKPDQVVYVRQGVLVGRRLDVASGRFAGEARHTCRSSRIRPNL